jgi:hypothetical protein
LMCCPKLVVAFGNTAILLNLLILNQLPISDFYALIDKSHNKFRYMSSRYWISRSSFVIYR